MQELREARGPGREGRGPVQGVPLALRLGRRLLLQLSQPPPLLLNHLLPCRSDRWESRGAPHLPREDAGCITDGGRRRAGTREHGAAPLPPTSFPEAPAAPGPAALATLCHLHNWSQPCSLTSALPLCPEPTRGTEPAQVGPRQHNGQVAPAHNHGLNRWAGHMHPPCCWGRVMQEMLGAP